MLASAMHGVIPLLFIAVVEAVRNAVAQATAAGANRRMDSIRIARWFLAPGSTWSIWRDMKLYEIRSFQEALERYQAKMLYRQDLQAEYGRGWRRKASGTQMRPLRQARLGIVLAEHTALSKASGQQLAPGTYVPQLPAGGPAGR
jgi:hypothetical protein